MDELRRDVDDHEARIRSLEAQVAAFVHREAGIVKTFSLLEKLVLIGLSFAGLLVSIVVLYDHLTS